MRGDRMRFLRRPALREALGGLFVVAVLASVLDRIPSQTAGLSFLAALWHHGRRCLRPAVYTCASQDWTAVEATSGPSLRAVGRDAPLMQRVAIQPMISPAFRKTLLHMARRPSFRWTTKRHRSYPTTDQELYLLARLDAAFTRELRASVLPAFASAFGVNATHLSVLDLFIVRYRANAQAALTRHADTSCLSFIVQLNELREFKGGGTLFDHASAPIHAPPGSALLFAGQNLHQAVRVTAGERFILAGFIGVGGPPEAAERLGREVVRAGGAGCPRHVQMERPDLRHNAARLRQSVEPPEARSGVRLVQALADGRVHMADTDLSQLSAWCKMWLQTGLVPLVEPAAVASAGGASASARPALARLYSRFFARFLLDTVGAKVVVERMQRAARLINETGRVDPARARVLDEMRHLLSTAKQPPDRPRDTTGRYLMYGDRTAETPESEP